MVAAFFWGALPCTAPADELKRLFKQVEKLKIERNGYVLGKKLTKKQLKIATANPLEAKAADTFKFIDNTIHVVAQKKTNRVMVIYEQFDNVSHDQIKNLIGDLYMKFDDPTIMAHDKIVYWAYAKKGKISSKEFDSAKKNKEKLSILATVKCISDIKIMEKAEEPSKGHAYYIISSDPILRFFREVPLKNG